MELELKGVGYEKNDFKDLESHSFGIDTEDEDIIVSIVRDKIYSDPIQVLVQEYICNGRDSNVEQGNPYNKLDVFVPSKAIQTFKARDYGTGLSHEQVVKVFIKLGKSTKRLRKDVIGAYGLGSKSGFAYTDSFLITSFYNGMKTQYLALIAENQKGDIKVLGREATDEPNGIEVEVNLKNEMDIEEFKNAIFRTTGFWENKPNYTNINDHEVEDLLPKEVFRNKDVLITKKNGLVNKNMILCDGVPYPFDQDPVYPDELRANYDHNYLYLTTNSEVKPAANRENIIKGKDLKKFTNTVCRKVNAIALKYKEEVKKCKSKEELGNFFENIPFIARFDDYTIDCLPENMMINGSDCFLFSEEYLASHHGKDRRDRWEHKPVINRSVSISDTLLIVNDGKIMSKSIARKLNNSSKYSKFLIFEGEVPESVIKFFDVKKYSEIKPKPVKREKSDASVFLQYYTAVRNECRYSFWSSHTAKFENLAKSKRYYAILNAWDLKDIDYSELEIIDSFLEEENREKVALVSYKQLEELKKVDGFNMTHVSKYKIDPGEAHKSAVFYEEYDWIPMLKSLRGIGRFSGYGELESINNVKGGTSLDAKYLKDNFPEFYEKTLKEFSYLNKYKDDTFMNYYASLCKGWSDNKKYESETSDRGEFIEAIKYIQENKIFYEDTKATQ